MDDAERAAARRRIPELIRNLESTSPGEWRRDPKERRQRMYAVLSRHADPVLREIGRQLADGRMRPADVLRSGTYAEAVRAAAVRAAGRLDPVILAGQLEQRVR